MACFFSRPVSAPSIGSPPQAHKRSIDSSGDPDAIFAEQKNPYNDAEMVDVEAAPFQLYESAALQDGPLTETLVQEMPGQTPGDISSFKPPQLDRTTGPTAFVSRSFALPSAAATNRPGTSASRPATGRSMSRPATAMSRPATAMSRPATAMSRPRTAGMMSHAEGDGRYIVAVLESHGVQREVGIAAMNQETGARFRHFSTTLAAAHLSVLSHRCMRFDPALRHADIHQDSPIPSSASSVTHFDSHEYSDELVDNSASRYLCWQAREGRHERRYFSRCLPARCLCYGGNAARKKVLEPRRG